MQAPPISGSPKPGKPILWILAAVFLGLALCCGGGVIFGVSLFQSGMRGAEKDLPYAVDVMTRLSNADYQLEKVRGDFDRGYFGGVQSQQFQVALDAFRNRLGKFRKAGKVTGFNVRTVNGRATRTVIFDAEFEKADGVVTFTTSGEGEEKRVTGLYVKSNVLEN